MNTRLKIEITINNIYSLWLPAEGVEMKLLRNEFNLLTNSVSDMRPLYVAQTFEVPLEPNRRVFEELKGARKSCQMKFNSISVMTGELFEYSVDEQRKVILVTIVSAFKSMIDFLGDNVLFLDKIDLSRWNYIVGGFYDDNSNDLLKFGYYNPMDTNTGYIEFDPSNIDDYCKPSISLWFYFQEAFRINGWSANWEAWSEKMKKTCLMPTTAYMCSSFGFKTSGKITIPASGSVRMPLSEASKWWNIESSVLGIQTPGCEILPDNRIQVRQPNRLMSFKLKALYQCPDAFSFTIYEGSSEMAFIPSLGDEKVSYVSDSVNLKEGIDPLFVELTNPNPRDISVDFSALEFYNLFSIYETNQDEYLPPQGYMFPVADNYPKLTPLDVYKELSTLFQMAQRSYDEVQEVGFYFLNEIPNKGAAKVDVNPYLFWNGYTILSDKINGLAKLNAIRYKGDKLRQRYFRVDIAPLPSNAVYFESEFAHGETNNGWSAVQVPSLKYKAKKVDGDSVEYLEYSEVAPQLGCYDKMPSGAARMIFQPLHITTLAQEYWGNLLVFMSSFDGYNPVTFQLKLRLSYYEYLDRFTQGNLFYYQSDCLMLSGEYDVLKQTFTGTFISLR